jgi:hypothetical protein
MFPHPGKIIQIFPHSPLHNIFPEAAFARLPTNTRERVNSIKSFIKFFHNPRFYTLFACNMATNQFFMVLIAQNFLTNRAIFEL